MNLKDKFISLIKHPTTINVDGWLTINIEDPNATVILDGVVVRSSKLACEELKKAHIDSEEPMWYIVDRHSNNRRKNSTGEPMIFSDYNAASIRAAAMSAGSGWYVPMRISEYNDVFGRFLKED